MIFSYVAKSRGGDKLKKLWLNFTHSHTQVQPLQMAALGSPNHPVVLQKLYEDKSSSFIPTREMSLFC